jgi:23S rRNA (uracil1939-C5)-methyltransferase
MDHLACSLAGRCGGCAWHDRPLALARSARVEHLRALLGPHLGDGRLDDGHMTTPASSDFRERLDLRLENGRLGLLGVTREDGVVDMDACPLVVPALADFLAALRRDLPPVARGSLRLRAHGGLRGLWLDLPHTSIRDLLEERRWLARWAPSTTLELGPKSRHVVLEGEAVVLRDPPLRPWAETFHGDRSLALCSTVQGFSQPGPRPNAALVGAVLRAVGRCDADRVVELGAGSGNLSLPLLLEGLQVRAVELDTSPLVATVAHNRASLGLAAQRLSVVAGSFEREGELPTLLQGIDTIVCDPPRSGLGRFIDGLARLSPGLRPEAMVYVSCHPEALARDVSRLVPLGYRMKGLEGIDQFPWTPHAEWVAQLSR